MKKKLLLPKTTLCLLTTLLTFSSCSQLEKLSNIPSKDKEIDYSTLFCKAPSKSTEFIAENTDALAFYKTIEQKNFSNNYNFIEKSILYTFAEMARRPDRLSPSSRLQLYLRLEGKDYYFDFHPLSQADLKSTLFGLNYISQKFNKKDYNYLLKTLDQQFSKEVIVTEDFAQFLAHNSKELYKSDDFYESFFKGDESLTKFETFKRLDFFKNFKYLRKDKNFDAENFYSDESTIFNITPTACNFPLNNEQYYFFDDQKTTDFQSFTISLAENNNVFQAVVSSELVRPLKPFANTYLITAKPSTHPVAFCMFKNNKSFVTVFSTKDRNSHQLIYNLAEYDIAASSDHFELNQALNFSRHLYLLRPDRILLESKTTRSKQLDIFLEMNVPTYHAESIGNLSSYAFLNKSTPQGSFHIDYRTSNKLSCQK